MNEKLDFQSINASILADYEGRLREWFPAGFREGDEFKIGSLTGEKGRSCSINIKTGQWADFAGNQKGGDPISLLAAIKGIKQVEAAKELSGLSLPVVEQKAKEVSWEPVPYANQIPLPQSKTHHKFGEPTATWEYRDLEDRLVGWVCRFDPEKDKKMVLPMCLTTDGQRFRWNFKAFDKPRPLYNGENLAKKPDATVIVVEGEKCVDALQAKVPKAVVISWPGGAKAMPHAQLEALKGRNVILWPDNDEPGFDAINYIADLLGHDVRIVEVPCDKPEGWDVADAIQEGVDPLLMLKSAVVRKAVQQEVATQVIEEAISEIQASYEEERSEPEPFKILGTDGSHYFYLPTSTRRIVSLTASQHKRLELIQLAPAHYWEITFPAKDGANWFAAANCLIQQASRLDFDLSRIRGRGAWLDSGKSIFHAGDHLLVDGVKVELDEFDSKFIYTRARPLDAQISNPITNRDAAVLIDLLSKIYFKNPLDHKLFAGWLALAPICGAMEWRPHIWLTGASGTGKSWIISNIVRPILGYCAAYFTSVTTEAGVRQTLGSDALPVLFDEAEVEKEADARRMQGVLILARQASREQDGKIAKGTASGNALSWHIRSAFLFASIGVAAVQRADISRITVLELLSEHQRKENRFAEIIELWEKTCANPEWCSGFRARSLLKAPVIAQNCAAFKTAVMKHLHNQRDADQIAALLAAAYSLTNGAPISLESAREWVDAQDWSTRTSEGGDRDEMRCVGHLLEAKLRYEPVDAAPKMLSVGELLALADEENYYSKGGATAALIRHGIKPHTHGMDVASSHQELSKIFKDTQWTLGWKDQLTRIPGSSQKAGVRFTGTIRRAVHVPYEAFA